MNKFLLLVMCSALAACGGSDSGSDSEDDNSDDGAEESSLPLSPAPLTTGSWYRPAPDVTWQWQLSGTVNTGYDVDLYDIDLFDSSTDLISSLQQQGRKVICYFSAGSYEDWRSDAAQFSDSDLGSALDDWEGERWLNIRSYNVHEIMEARLDLAVSKGCDGVEPDNMDGYQNDNGVSLSASDQLAYNRFIANEAHERGLSVGLKNDLDQIEALVDYFDFALNEQCAEYDECDLLSPFIDAGKAVLQAEYADGYVNNSSTRTALCSAANAMQFSALILPLDLDDSFRYACNES